MSDAAPIPWFEPVIDTADIEAVNAVVTSGFVNEGPQNRAFEQDLAAYFDVPYAVTAPSGTMSLALSLMACNVGRGDKVLVPSSTFIGTASAVRLAGAEPVLVDVDPAGYTMCPDAAARRITPDVKAVIPVHLTGRAADMERINHLAAEHGLAVIEDAAEAIGCRDDAGWLGTRGDAGCFSLAPTKIITAGQGGFILTRSAEIRDRLIRLRDHGRLSRASDVHEFTGFNFKVTDMQAALARSQFSKLDARIARAREIDSLYLDALRDCPGIRFAPRPRHGYLMWPDFEHDRRDHIVAALKEQGMTLRPYWPAVHMQPAYRDEDALFPNAVKISRTACWLPCSPNITNDAIGRVAEAVLKAAAT